MGWQNLITILLGGLLTLIGSYFALRWQFKRTAELQRKDSKEKTYVRLQGLRIAIRQTIVSRYEALIYSDYHEYKWKNYGGNAIDLEEAKRWMQKSEKLLEEATNLIREIFECIANIHISYKTTDEISKMADRLYNYKTLGIKSPLKGEVTIANIADLENWKTSSVSQLDGLVTKEYAEPIERLLKELRKQLGRD